MAKFILYKWHKTGISGNVKIPDKASASKVVELMQANQKRYNGDDGITWQTHEGDFVSALIADAKVMG